MRKIDVQDGELTVNELLDGVAAGEQVEVVRDGRRVARLYRDPPPMSEAERAAAIERMRRRMREGFSCGGQGMPSRDEMHER
jgi:antitoxin (DNA-binding transcriptional repressor) of toxin-antitoxin stability system